MNPAIGILIVALVLTPQSRLGAAEGPPLDARGLQKVVDSAVSGTLEEFAAKRLQSNQLAVTLVDLREPSKPAQAGYRGGEMSWILENNMMMNRDILALGGKVYKTYRIVEKPL